MNPFIKREEADYPNNPVSFLNRTVLQRRRPLSSYSRFSFQKVPGSIQSGVLGKETYLKKKENTDFDLKGLKISSKENAKIRVKSKFCKEKKKVRKERSMKWRLNEIKEIEKSIEISSNFKLKSF